MSKTAIIIALWIAGVGITAAFAVLVWSALFGWMSGVAGNTAKWTVGLLVTAVIAMLLWSLTFSRAIGALQYTNTETRAELILNQKSDEVIIVFVGFQNSALKVGATLAPAFQQSRNVILVEYPKRGFSFDAGYDAVMGKVREHPHIKKLSLYGGSMGALMTAKFMSRYWIEGMPLGKLRTVLFDDPVTSGRATVFGKLGLRVGSLLPHDSIMQRLKAWIVYNQVRHAKNAAESKDPEFLANLEAHYRAMADCPMPAFTAQLRFMLETDMTSMKLAGIAENVVLVTGGDGDGDDPLIKMDVSRRELRTAFGDQPIHEHIDPAREKGEHNTAAERPTFMTETLNRYTLAA